MATSTSNPARARFGVNDWFVSLAWGAVVFLSSRAHDVFAPGVTGSSWAGVAWIAGPTVSLIFLGIVVGTWADGRVGGGLWGRRFSVGLNLFFVFQLILIVWAIAARG